MPSAYPKHMRLGHEYYHARLLVIWHPLQSGVGGSPATTCPLFYHADQHMSMYLLSLLTSPHLYAVYHMLLAVSIPLLLLQEVVAAPKKKASRKKSTKEGKRKGKQAVDSPADYELL